MEVVKLKYSKSKVDKAGETLKQISPKATDDETALALSILSNWRAIHAMSLDTLAKVLKARVKKIGA